MSVYDHRETPAYDLVAPAQYAENPHIARWWSPAHDELLAERIRDHHWTWPWGTTDPVVEITPGPTIERWKDEDPLCGRYAWYNVLMFFAVARARCLGLEERMRKPQWKVCPLCDQRFVEDSLPLPLIERLGLDRLDFCAPCLKDAVLQGSGDPSMPRNDILVYLRELSEATQGVPYQAYGEGVGDLMPLSDRERLQLLRVLQRKPKTQRVKDVFGSWLNALVAAGVLTGAVEKTPRGVRCTARDGHICLSLAEKTIDDFLYSRGIQHTKEPPYPEGGFRADFAAGDALIEYFGLKGDPEYDRRTRLKQSVCRKHGVVLVALYPGDLGSKRRLESKLLRGLGADLVEA